MTADRKAEIKAWIAYRFGDDENDNWSIRAVLNELLNALNECDDISNDMFMYIADLEGK